LLVCAFVAMPPPEIEVPLPLAPEASVEQQTFVRTWQFVERAAPPSRAPAAMV